MLTLKMAKIAQKERAIITTLTGVQPKYLFSSRRLKLTSGNELTSHGFGVGESWQVISAAFNQAIFKLNSNTDILDISCDVIGLNTTWFYLRVVCTFAQSGFLVQRTSPRSLDHRWYALFTFPLWADNRNKTSLCLGDQSSLTMITTAHAVQARNLRPQVVCIEDVDVRYTFFQVEI